MGILAIDSAADTVYDDGWQNGDNGGSGWGAWDFPRCSARLGPPMGALA